MRKLNNGVKLNHVKIRVKKKQYNADMIIQTTILKECLQDWCINGC